MAKHLPGRERWAVVEMVVCRVGIGGLAMGGLVVFEMLVCGVRMGEMGGRAAGYLVDLA